MFFFKKKETINIPYESLIYALCVLIYVFAVAMLMNNGQHIFGKNPSVFGAAAFLLLFVFSATIVGLLILGKPTTLYFSGMQKEAIRLLLSTMGWLFVLLLCILSLTMLVKM